MDVSNRVKAAIVNQAFGFAANRRKHIRYQTFLYTRRAMSRGESWGGIGIENLRRAGYGDIVRLIEAPSYRALSELERSGQRIDFVI